MSKTAITAIFMAALAIVAPVPFSRADPPSDAAQRVPCAALDKVRESLDDDIDFDYLRDSLNQGLGAIRTRNTADAI